MSSVFCLYLYCHVCRASELINLLPLNQLPLAISWCNLVSALLWLEIPEALPSVLFSIFKLISLPRPRAGVISA